MLDNYMASNQKPVYKGTGNGSSTEFNGPEAFGVDKVTGF